MHARTRRDVTSGSDHDAVELQAPSPKARAGRPRRTAKDRALLLLAVRWRSRQEIASRLRRAGFEAADIERAVEDLERAGLIDDARFAAEVVGARASRRLAGDRAIRTELRQKGVGDDVAEQALERAGSEEERATRLAEAKIGRMTSLETEAAYRRLYGLLLRRGFGPNLARDTWRMVLLRSGAEPEDDST